MARRIWLFGLILIIPLIGLAVAEGIQAHFNSEFRAILIEEFPNAEPSAISQINVNQLCQENTPELEEFCNINRNLDYMSAGAMAAMIIGMALLLFIRLAGSAARNNRMLLLLLFKPGLYITALILICLILIHASVAIGAIYYGESMLLGRIHVGIIAVIALGALGGTFIMARNVFSLVRKAQIFVIGTNLSRKEAPELWGRVEQLADRIGALRPQNIVLGLDPNFFVTEANVTCLNEQLAGRTLYCSLPLSRILSTNELTAIIGHELGHFKGLDTRFSGSFYPIYRGTASAISSLEATGKDSAAAIALLPAIVIFSYFLECFSIAESQISRNRELAADKEGAVVTNKVTFATALVKIHAFSGIWNNLHDAATKALEEGKAFINISKTYAETVAIATGPEILTGIDENHLSHPTDSHPRLGTRLESLGVTMDAISKSSLDTNPVDAAINLIPIYEQKEEELSQVFQVLLAKQNGIDLEETLGDNTLR